MFSQYTGKVHNFVNSSKQNRSVDMITVMMIALLSQGNGSFMTRADLLITRAMQRIIVLSSRAGRKLQR